jgi:hypothetical protein
VAKLSEWKKEPCESIILFGKETQGTRKFEVLHGEAWTKYWVQRRFPFTGTVEIASHGGKAMLHVVGTERVAKALCLPKGTTPQEAADELDKMAAELVGEMVWFDVLAKVLVEQLEEKV